MAEADTRTNAEESHKRAHASVRFSGPNLDPLVVTNALELPPDHQHRDGEPRLSRSGKGNVLRYADYRGGLWSMSSESSVESPRSETHLDWLLSQLEPRSDAIRDLLSSGIDADFFCFSSGSSESPPSLPRAIRDRADALGIKIEIDHYPDRPDARRPTAPRPSDPER